MFSLFNRPLEKVLNDPQDCKYDFEQLQTISDQRFRRACGVKRATFEAMIEALEQAERRKCKSGRPSELSLADQVLVTLLDHYDYRTREQLEVGV